MIAITVATSTAVAVSTAFLRSSLVSRALPPVGRVLRVQLYRSAVVGNRVVVIHAVQVRCSTSVVQPGHVWLQQYGLIVRSYRSEPFVGQP